MGAGQGGAAEPKALLLAAGLGTRLRPLTDVLPKCLVPICGRPLLGYWLELLDRAGFSRIVVNLHHHADLVRQYVEQTPYAAKVELVYEEKLLGTGGTLLANRSLLDGGPVLVAHADNLSVFDVQSFLSRHSGRPSGCDMTMMTFETDDPQSCGIVELDQRGVVTGFHEKVRNPPGNIANAAIYIFEPSIFDELAALGRATLDLSMQLLPAMVGRALTYPNMDFHCDIGTPRALAIAQFALPLLCPANFAIVLDESWKLLLQRDDGRLARTIVKNLGTALGAADQ